MSRIIKKWLILPTKKISINQCLSHCGVISDLWIHLKGQKASQSGAVCSVKHQLNGIFRTQNMCIIDMHVHT